MLFIKSVMSFKKYSNSIRNLQFIILMLLYPHQRIGTIKRILKRSLKQIHDRNLHSIVEV